MRVAILGAGPMGLAAAYYLSRAGLRPVVFEADSIPGGMSATFDFNGVRIERYYHFINRPDTNLFALLDELHMGDALHWQQTRMGLFSRHKGTPTLFPWGNPVALLRYPCVSLLTRLRYGLHAFSCKFLKDLSPLDDCSAADWFRRWEGEEGYNTFWRLLFEKKFFELADPLSAAWIASRIRRVANSRESLMQESLGYLEGGCEQLVSRLVSEIEAAGGKVLVSTPVEKVLLGTSVEKVTHSPSHEGLYKVTANGEEIEFDAVISTIPLPLVPGIIPNLPPAHAKVCENIRNVGCACALFRLDKPLTENFWLNIFMPEWDIPGIIEYSNLRPMNAAHVYVPFYMPHSHPNWQADDETLLNKARTYLYAINPNVQEQAAQVFRYTWAQPVCPPGFRHVLPPYAAGPGLFIADTTHSFPEDRSINESVRIGKELAAAVQALA